MSPTIRTAVRLAIAAAAAAAAANSASALDISTYNAATAVNVYLSGSTAVDNTILNAAIETAAPGGLCHGGHDRYLLHRNDRLVHQSHDLLHAQRLELRRDSGSPLAIYKESTAGSQNGVTFRSTRSAGGRLVGIELHQSDDDHGCGLQWCRWRCGRGLGQLWRIHEPFELPGDGCVDQRDAERGLLRRRGRHSAHDRTGGPVNSNLAEQVPEIQGPPWIRFGRSR